MGHDSAEDKAWRDWLGRAQAVSDSVLSKVLGGAVDQVRELQIAQLGPCCELALEAMLAPYNHRVRRR